MEVCLLGLEDGDGSLCLLVLSLLSSMVSLHLLLSLVHIISERLADVSRFTGEVLLEVLFLRAERLDLIVVESKLLSEGLAGLFKTSDLALKSSVILARVVS